MRGKTEIVGTLRGFDDYVNLVLDDAIEYSYTTGSSSPDSNSLTDSEIKKTELQNEILLNGGNLKCGL